MVMAMVTPHPAQPSQPAGQSASQPASQPSPANPDMVLYINTPLMLMPMVMAMVMAIVTPPTLPTPAPPRAIYCTIPIPCCGANTR